MRQSTVLPSTNLHGLRHLLGGDGGLDPAGRGVHPGRHPQVVE